MVLFFLVVVYLAWVVYYVARTLRGRRGGEGDGTP
jgi:hypothetical protein